MKQTLIVVVVVTPLQGLEFHLRQKINVIGGIMTVRKRGLLSSNLIQGGCGGRTNTANRVRAIPNVIQNTHKIAIEIGESGFGNAFKGILELVGHLDL